MRASSTLGATPRTEARQAERRTPSTSPTPHRRPRCSTRAGSCGWASRTTCRSTPATFDRKLAVFAGPVLDPADPPYRGIQVPAAVLEGRRLRPGRRTGRHRLPARPVAAGRRPRRRPRRGGRRGGAAAAGRVPHVPGADRRHRRRWPAWTSTSWSSSTGSRRRRPPRRRPPPAGTSSALDGAAGPWTTSGSDRLSSGQASGYLPMLRAAWATCSRPSRTRPGAPSSTNSRSGTARRCSSCAPG